MLLGQLEGCLIFEPASSNMTQLTRSPGTSGAQVDLEDRSRLVEILMLRRVTSP